ncbi:MAG: TCR/Tet family MFS transporter [Sphingopyxis sp.]
MISARRTLPFIVATIFIDAMGFGIIMPVLPRLVMEIGHVGIDEAIDIGTWIGLLMALCTFFAAPVLGNLSDRFGRRPVLLISLAGLVVDYALLAVAHTLPLLFLARAISGIFGGSFAAAQAAIADITTPDQRARNFGMVGAAFGIGFIAGPMIGGLLGDMDPRTPFIVASALAALNFVYGLTIFPETLVPENRRTFDWRRANPLGALRVVRGAPGMAAIAIVFALWQLASLVYPLTWSFYAIAQFGWSSAMIGASFAVVGVAITIGQVAVTGPMVARLGERDAASVGILFATIGFLTYAFITQTWMAFAIMVVLVFQAPVQPSLMAMLSRRAAPETQGEMQGISAMAMGLASLAAPLVLTGTMGHFTGPDAPVQFPGAAFIVAVAFGIAALVMIRRLPRVAPAEPQE